MRYQAGPFSRILVSLPEADLETIDAFCKKELITRSEFLTIAALAYIKKGKA